MSLIGKKAKIKKNIFLDKLITEEEETKSRKNSTSSDFKLEYQKFKLPPNTQAKFTQEFQKLIELVKESNLYRDINGNKITKKGKLLLTPFQKIRKINDEIKTYFDNRINKKNSQLIIKNIMNKEDEYLKVFNFNSERNKIIKSYQNKSRNIISNKYNEKHYITMGKLSFKNIMNKELKPIINKKRKNKENRKIYFSLINQSNHCIKKYFNDSEFNQVNFWNPKIIKNEPLNKTNYFAQKMPQTIRNQNFITEYNNKNYRELNNHLHKYINIKKVKRNKMDIESKSPEETNKNDKERAKYKLFQFDLHQLIKPNPKYKGKIVLNTRSFITNIKNNIKIDGKKSEIKKKENKIIGVNMDESDLKTKDKKFKKFKSQ